MLGRDIGWGLGLQCYEPLKSCHCYISATVRCRKLRLARDIAWGDVGVQHHDVTLI